MSKPVGGRGKKAPYETVTIRVPVPLQADLEKQVNDYREFVVNGTQSEVKALPDRAAAIAHAKEILKQKKSARESLLKLLQVLYGGEISLKD
jgi:hypothetical protein